MPKEPSVWFAVFIGWNGKNVPPLKMLLSLSGFCCSKNDRHSIELGSGKVIHGG
jgi:hypothetical protein